MMRLARLNWLFIAIVALGAALRFWGINFGLPYTYAPDETWHLSVALGILKTGDLNPYWLGYPHLAFYLNAILLFFHYIGGRLLGAFTSTADLPYPDVLTVGVGRLDMPAEFLLARGLTALFGSASILLVYLIGRRLHPSSFVGLAGAFFFAISPANVYNSHLIRLDTFAMFFVLLAFFWIDRALVKPNLRNYLWAGTGVGLAFAGKYNALLIAVALVVAHFLNFGWRAFFHKEIYIAGIASVLAFAVTNPFSILDLPGFFYGLTLASSAQTSHIGMEGDTVRWYASFLWASEGVLLILALVQAMLILVTRNKRGLVLLSFPVLYYLFINQFNVRNDRTVMLVIPFMDLLAALCVADLYERVKDAWRVSPRLSYIGLGIAAALIALTPLQNSIQSDSDLLRSDARETARVWIEKNLPRGSRIALEAYSPYVDRNHFMVEGFERIIDHSPDWYAQNGFEDLVFSYGAYGRYYEDSDRFSNFVARYEAFFSRFSELKRFAEGGTQIRIYETNVTALPTQRTAARFGEFGGWVELVGYDPFASNWQSGNDQRIRLYWRALKARRNPLMLTVRLIDRDDREIWQSRAPLFGDAHADGFWPQGITRTEREISVPKNLESGLYRVQIEIDSEGVGRVPLLSITDQPIADKYFLGPFKISAPPPSSAELTSAQTVNANFGNVITLLASSTNFSAHPGDSFALQLYWRANAKIEKDYTVFIHLLDASGKILAQIDAQPYGGAYPTSLWEIGEIIRDYRTLTLPSDLASGEYKIELGLYEYSNLARLNVVATTGEALDDHLILTTVKVVR